MRALDRAWDEAAPTIYAQNFATELSSFDPGPRSPCFMVLVRTTLVELCPLHNMLETLS